MHDERIITAIRRGDETAIDHVITRYSKLLWTVVSGVLKGAGSTQDVEECVADVFIYLWQNPEKYDPERGRLKVWLSIMARTHAIDKYRELSRRGEQELHEGVLVQELGVLDGILARDARQRLAEAVQALEEPDREIVLRRYWEDQKPKEIARALAMPVKHVENHLYRAKQKLRRAVSD